VEPENQSSQVATVLYQAEIRCIKQAVAPKDTSTILRLTDKKLEHSQNNDLKTLESAANASNETFKPGDMIRVKAPWGESAIAEIVTLYQDLSGNNWAYYVPFEPSPPPDWSWLGGCIQASLLVKPK